MIDFSILAARQKFEPSIKRKSNEEEIKNHSERNYTITLPFTGKRCEKIARKISSAIRQITPEYKINFAWSTIQIRNTILPKLKLRKQPLEKNGTVYCFTCPCEKSYIGESRKILTQRIRQHGWPSSKSSIYEHIKSCDKYLEKQTIFKDQPNPAHKTSELTFEFLKSHFCTLSTGLQNYHRRVQMEGLMITIKRPELNDQIFHRSMKII